MGEVFEAQDLKLRRQVALKFLPEELSRDPQMLERFEREARAASALDHPNICTVHEIGEHEHRPFIVMQYLEGGTLQRRIGEKPIDVQTVVFAYARVRPSTRSTRPAHLNVPRGVPARLMVCPAQRDAYRGRSPTLSVGPPPEFVSTHSRLNSQGGGDLPPLRALPAFGLAW
jgi:Protein kinase domain